MKQILSVAQLLLRTRLTKQMRVVVFVIQLLTYSGLGWERRPGSVWDLTLLWCWPPDPWIRSHWSCFEGWATFLFSNKYHSTPCPCRTYPNIARPLLMSCTYIVHSERSCFASEHCFLIHPSPNGDCSVGMFLPFTEEKSVQQNIWWLPDEESF